MDFSNKQLNKEERKELLSKIRQHLEQNGFNFKKEEPDKEEKVTETTEGSMFKKLEKELTPEDLPF